MVQAVPYSALTGLVQMNRRQGSIFKNTSMLVLDYGDAINVDNLLISVLNSAILSVIFLKLLQPTSTRCHANLNNIGDTVNQYRHL